VLDFVIKHDATRYLSGFKYGNLVLEVLETHTSAQNLPIILVIIEITAMECIDIGHKGENAKAEGEKNVENMHFQ
jgi:hypothetical protein